MCCVMSVGAFLKELDIPGVLGGMQTSVVVGTTQILQKTLGLGKIVFTFVM